MKDVRKQITDEIVTLIKQILPKDKSNEDYTRNRLESLTDAQFKEYMALLESGEEYIHVYLPALHKVKMSLERNLALAEKLGIHLYERIWYNDPSTGMRTLSRGQGMLLLLPIRMQAQMLEKKDSIPLDNVKLDELSGQVTGDDKGSRVSFPELGSMNSEGLLMTPLELVKARGGDREAYDELANQISTTGVASLTPLLTLGTKAKSQEIVSNLLAGMHLDNTF